MSKSSLLFQDLIDEYSSREPDGSDTWNPLRNEKELWHRVRLFIALGWALEQIETPITQLKVLDVGCGVGRSTRALLEFGVRPENVVGIDLRPAALIHAKQVNPALTFHTVNGVDRWPAPQSFHLCMQCTVFSSIDGYERRLVVAQMMERMTIPGGYIFWWDRIKANTFAGKDELNPFTLFNRSTLIGQRLVSLRPTFSEAVHSKYLIPFLGFFEKHFGHAPTHLMALFRRTHE
jgi:SAM-dependent methyltransferase